MKQQSAEPVFPKVFPRPTGVNGWEELVRAGDLLRLNPGAWPVGIETASLSRQRAALGTRPVREALALVRTGLGKPIASPRQQLDFTTTFPDLALFRVLSRLMSVAIRGHFADGRILAGCDAVRDGLTVSSVPCSEALIGSLVGVAMHSIVVDRAARHVDGISARECDLLVGFLRRRLTGPSPFASGLRRESEGVLVALEAALRPNQPAPLMTDDDPQGMALNRTLAGVRGNAVATATLMAQVRDAVQARLASELAALAQPWREPATPPGPPPGTIAARLLLVVQPVYGRSRDNFVSSQAKDRLLAVKLLIRRFVWENDRLPTALSELKSPDLTLDPFTGDPLIYQVVGPGAYRLEAAGPRTRDALGEVVGSARTPVSLWPDKSAGKN